MVREPRTSDSISRFRPRGWDQRFRAPGRSDVRGDEGRRSQGADFRVPSGQRRGDHTGRSTDERGDPVTRPPAEPVGGPSSAPRRPCAPIAGAAPQDVPDVIRFPGPRKPFRGPDLKNLRLDSRLLQWVRSESDRLGKRLLHWWPCTGVGTRQGRRDQSEPYWDALAKTLARVDKRVLRELAADASRHADQYAGDSNVHQFWKAMASFYQDQGAP